MEEIDAGTVYHHTVWKSLVEVDQSLTNIDSQKLATEMVPLRFELFALAWQHKFGEKSTIPQSVFTKQYLQEKGRADIWNAAGIYNNAIGRSSRHGMTIEKGMDRAYIVFVDQTRSIFL